MTTKGEWIAYTGSDEQIGELKSAKNGAIFKYSMMSQIVESKIINETELDEFIFKCYPIDYLIIPDDPLREMKVRQAQTGQLVYVKTPSKRAKGKSSYYKTTNPNWGEIGAEYLFTAFEDTPK